MLTPPAPTLAASPAQPYAAYDDGISGLAGCPRLRAALAGALAAAEPAALIYAIPHDISLVVDGMGPEAAETLLDLMGRRLAGLLGPRDHVARTSDDAFVLVVR